MDAPWFDTHMAAYARNVQRIVEGTVLDIDDNRRGITEQTVTVDRLINLFVGIDSTGLFVRLNVMDEGGSVGTAYSDRSSHDDA